MDQDNSHNNDVLIFKDGPLGRITLNRPKSLNALNLDMIRAITFALDGWVNDDSIKAIFIDGAGDRAFCAGGDIKNFYSIGMDYRRGKIGQDVAMLFFNEEYDLNEKIFNYSKPIISFMHGITMGGGYGIAGHAKFKIISDDAVFAMPETRIGFFPDIGSMYHLTRMPNKIGLFLAVTGATIDADGMNFCGVGQYRASKSEIDAILEQLKSEIINSSDVESALEQFLQSYKYNATDISKIEQISKEIESIFSSNLVDAIEMLKKKHEEFSNINALCSSMSMVIAYEYYRYAEGKNIADIIAMDKHLCANLIMRSEFYEGVRAALIDKDKSPQWEYKKIEDVPSELISSYFN